MPDLTTHVLDVVAGRPAIGVAVKLYWLATPDDASLILSTRTNALGRCSEPMLKGHKLAPGKYRMTFGIGEYFRKSGFMFQEPAFLDTVPIEFGIDISESRYHIALLISPFGYLTFRDG
ncbi:MAG: hydroxyisourate hydrolase [Pseudomonadota bacterium]